MKKAISKRWNAVRTWVEQTYTSSHFYDVLKTASAEIAVLLFVFPLIDQFAKPDVKAKGFDLKLVICSFFVGLVFVGLAGFFARREHESKMEEDKK